MTPDVSVVVVTWNGRRYLDDCLKAVAAQQDPALETIVVDNASDDGSADHVRVQFPWVRVVTLDENRGFAGGNNAGAREARGRFVAFLNNDTIADPGWLGALRRAIDEPARVVLTTSRIVYMHDPQIIDSAGDGLLRSGGAFKRHHGDPASTATQSMEVFGVCGAACLVSRAVFQELGGFDEAFFASHEDVDLSYRARLLGFRCRYVADSVVRHHGSATLGRLSTFAVFHGQRNLEWVYFKNTPARLLARTLLGHMLYTLAAAAHFTHAGQLGTFVRAKLAAARSAGRVGRQRQDVQRSRRVADNEIWRLLEPRWLGAKWREKRFDRRLARGKA